MSNARTRRNRRAGIAANAELAFAVNTYWRTNPMMRPAIDARKGRFTRDVATARRWDDASQSWVADEARERSIVRTEFDTPLLPEVAAKRRDGVAGVRYLENDGGRTVIRTADDSAMKSKPAKRQQRGGGQEVETWASKKD
jgi:hypothetical protein